MQNGKSTLERALELAREGSCRTVGEIKRKLSAEGHDGVQVHLGGKGIGDQLKKLISKRS